MLGVDHLPSRGEASEVLHACEDAVTAADRASDLDRDIAHAAEVSERADQTLETRRQALEKARTEHRAALDAWRDWCRQRGLPEMTDPDLVPDLIAGIGQAAALCARIEEVKRKMAGLSGDIRSFAEEVVSVAEACNEPSDGPTDTVLEGLIRVLNAEEEARRRYAALAQTVGGGGGRETGKDVCPV
jgi:hypothetical protein